MSKLFSPARLNLRWRFLLVLLPITLGTTLSMGLIARQFLVASHEREVRANAQSRLQAQVLPVGTLLRAIEFGLDRLSMENDARAFLAQWDEVEALFTARREGDGVRLTRIDRGGSHDEVFALDSAPMWVRRSLGVMSMTAATCSVLDARLQHAGSEGDQVLWLQRNGSDATGSVGAILRPATFAPALAASVGERGGMEIARVILLDACGHPLAWNGEPVELAPLDPDLVAVRHAEAQVGFEVVQLLSARELAGGLARLDRALLLVGGGAFILISLVILLLTRRVVVPIERLTRTMGDVARGDLSQRLPVSGSDEIAQLSRSFNTMISDLHTTHVALKAQSARLTAALHEVEDVEAMKDSFLALVSHEVRTPLTSIMGGVEFLREEFGDGYDDTQKEFMGIVYDSARRLAGFMNDAIMMASLQASRSRSSFENFSITALLHSKFDEIVAPAGRRGLRVENRMDIQREFFVHGDWTLLQVALEKVLHNAVRHNQPEGQVVVEVVDRILEDDDGDLDRIMTARGLEIADPQMHWRAVRVFNTGPVIPAAKVEGLFARFELTHDISNHQRGSGLSLPIAHYVLGYHGGCIQVRAIEHEGMAFYLVLPGKLSIQARVAAVDLPSGIDETVTTAHFVRAAAEDVERLEAGIEAAEREDRRLRQERGETLSGAVEVVSVSIGARLEEIGVRRNPRSHVPQPDASGD